jgi:hypothetical protein
VTGVRFLASAVALAALAACAPPTHYQWGAYEPSLYSFYKHPDQADDYTAQLQKAIDRGEAEGHVAPGLHAEYGYMLMSAGKNADAVAQFQAEKQLWPESTVLMDHMIKLASDKNGAPSPSAAATKADATQ